MDDVTATGCVSRNVKYGSKGRKAQVSYLLCGLKVSKCAVKVNNFYCMSFKMHGAFSLIDWPLSDLLLIKRGLSGIRKGMLGVKQVISLVRIFSTFSIRYRIMTGFKHPQHLITSLTKKKAETLHMTRFKIRPPFYCQMCWKLKLL